MSDTTVKAKTKILLEVEHECGPWSDSITMKELRDKSREEARAYVDRVVSILYASRIKSRLVTIHTPTVDLSASK